MLNSYRSKVIGAVVGLLFVVGGITGYNAFDKYLTEKHVREEKRTKRWEELMYSHLGEKTPEEFAAECLKSMIEQNNEQMLDQMFPGRKSDANK